MFLGQTHFGKLFVGLCFLKKYCVVTLLYMTIYEKCIIFGNANGKMHDLLALKRYASFIRFLGMDFVIFGKLIENLSDKKWFWKIWELCEMLGYYKVLWNYLEINYEFQFHLAVRFMLFIPLCCDKCDYPVRCCSLCDIGILAPRGLMSLWHNWCIRGIFDVFVA